MKREKEYRGCGVDGKGKETDIFGKKIKIKQILVGMNIKLYGNFIHPCFNEKIDHACGHEDDPVVCEGGRHPDDPQQDGRLHRPEQ